MADVQAAEPDLGSVRASPPLDWERPLRFLIRVEVLMKLMSRTAVLGTFLVCVGCADTMSDNPPATYPDNPPATEERPVGTTGSTAPREPAQVESSRRGQIPVGQELDVRLQTP